MPSGSNYSSGFQTGFQSTANPFAPIIKRVDEARARKMADDKDLRELKGLFVQLGMKHEYDKSLQEDKTKQEEFYKSYEPAQEGEPYVPMKGTPFESIAGQVNWKKKQVQQQPIVLVDPVTGEQRQVGTQQKGTKVITQKQSPEQEITIDVRKKELTKAAELLPKLEQAEKAVNMLKKQYYRGDTPKSVKKGNIFGGLMERGKGIGQGVMANIGANAELKTYIANRKSFASLISKGGFLEAGMLTNQDIERILGSLPSSGSTKEESDAAWREIEGILGSARKSYEDKLKSYTGQEKSQDDFSSLSDEELMAIAEGR